MTSIAIPAIGMYVKSFMAIVGLIPIVSSLVILVFYMGKAGADLYGPEVTFLGTLLGTAVLALPVMSSLSIKLSSDGVEQTSFLLKGVFRKRIALKWVDVERVTHKGMTLSLYGGVDKVVIGFVWFNDYKSVIAFLSDKLPGKF
ncbi:hypothetical protein [Dyella choica]|uniref:Uncharacterized protein n=1 Tax=Dyella choica TaxID=1927959 RepID=A0A432M7Y6_9GAMM|nr:hypothetical protein [Dyella choica]RUL77617.1 hypothetical protein EKH80_06995 [Dyella choica]